MKKEHCIICDDETGRAGRTDDSIYLNGYGPLCEECREKLDPIANSAAQERKELKTEKIIERRCLRLCGHIPMGMCTKECPEESYEKSICFSCEQTRRTRRYVVESDHHGRENYIVRWCDECHELHSGKGLKKTFADSGIGGLVAHLVVDEEKEG